MTGLTHQQMIDRLGPVYSQNTKCDRCGWPASMPVVRGGQTICPRCAGVKTHRQIGAGRPGAHTALPDPEPEPTPPPATPAPAAKKPAKKPKADDKKKYDLKSGRMGVYWSNERQNWYAQICINGERYSLGSSEDLQQAIGYREEAERDKTGVRRAPRRAKHTAETRARISQKMKGKKQTPEHVRNRMAAIKKNREERQAKRFKLK